MFQSLESPIILPGSFENIIQRVSDKDPTLTDIQLSFRHVTNQQLEQLTTCLLEKDIVTTLDLRSNNIDDTGASHIAAIIKHKPTITEINISSNQITDQGAIIIADVLKENTTLRKLNIGGNRIQREGIEALSQALATNRGLTEISCGFNKVINSNDQDSIANETAFIMLPHLQENTTLTHINVGGRVRGRDGQYKQAIQQLEKRNKRIIQFPESPSVSPSASTETSRLVEENQEQEQQNTTESVITI